MESDGESRQRNRRTQTIGKEGITKTEMPEYELNRKRKIIENQKFLNALLIKPIEPAAKRLRPDEQKHLASGVKASRSSIAPEEHREYPRTRSATAAAAPGAAAHQEQQRSSSRSASGAASAAAERQTRVDSLARSTRHSFLVGQKVWARDPQHGEAWWPATVTAVCPSFRVTWENPQNCDPIFSPADTHNVRERLLCKCGSCTAEMLEDVRALQEHEVRVKACISHTGLKSRVEEIRKNSDRWSPTRSLRLPPSLRLSVTLPPSVSPPPRPPPRLHPESWAAPRRAGALPRGRRA